MPVGILILIVGPWLIGAGLIVVGILTTRTLHAARAGSLTFFVVLLVR